MPLGIAFVVGRRAPTKRYTYGYGRAEDLAAIVIRWVMGSGPGVDAVETVRIRWVGHELRAEVEIVVENSRRNPFWETLMTHAHDILDELRQPGRDLRQAIPDVYAGFAATHHAVMIDGALPVKVKELIALAIAVTRECDGCVVAHAKSSAAAKATEAEVAEAMGVAILMNGGPATVWGPRALAAFREFAEPSDQSPEGKV